ADYADDGNSLIGVISIDKSMSWDSEYSEEYLDLQAKYVYANGMLLARYDTSPADTHYYHHDGLGSVIGMTNEAGNVVQSYFYDDFGNSLGSWGSVSNSYLYTGQAYDGSISGLYNLRARYYDSSIGRFVSEDPLLGFSSKTGSRCPQCPLILNFAQKSFLAQPQSLNRYLYVRNNPINYIDPTGRQGKQEDYYPVVIFDESEFWECICANTWALEPAAVQACIGVCLLCFIGVDKACFLCAGCIGYGIGTVLYCLDQATTIELVPGPRRAPYVPPDITPPRAH
ncbi:MAG: RHS repeat-associated core domain-containing protein, partial [bacterium]